MLPTTAICARETDKRGLSCGPARSLTCTGIGSLVPTDRWGESLSAANLLCTGMVYTGALLAGGGTGLVVGLLARDGLNRAGEGETRGLDGEECVVAIGLHTAGRDGDVRDGGGGRDATALSGGKSASSWWAGSGEAEGGGGSVVLAVVLLVGGLAAAWTVALLLSVKLLACKRPMDFLKSPTMDLSV